MLVDEQCASLSGSAALGHGLAPVLNAVKVPDVLCKGFSISNVLHRMLQLCNSSKKWDSKMSYKNEC